MIEKSLLSALSFWFPVFIAIVGWCVLHWQSNQLESNKLSRKAVDDIKGLLKELDQECIKYYVEEEVGLEYSIAQKLNYVEAELERLPGAVGSDGCLKLDSELVCVFSEYYQAVTIHMPPSPTIFLAPIGEKYISRAEASEVMSSIYNAHIDLIIYIERLIRIKILKEKEVALITIAWICNFIAFYIFLSEQNASAVVAFFLASFFISAFIEQSHIKEREDSETQNWWRATQDQKMGE